MDFFSGIWDWFKGNSLTSSLAKVAMVGYASKLLNSNVNPSVSNTTVPDPGTRLQLDPSTDNAIPVLYGSAYFGGYITDAVLSSDYKSMTYCLTLCEITGTKLSTNTATGYTFNKVYLNGNRVVFKSDGLTVDYTLDSSGNQDISYRDLIQIYLYGNQTGIHPTGIAGTTPAPWTVMSGWSQSTHQMNGLIYAIVHVNYNKDKNVTGLPECTFHITSDMTLPGDVIVDYMNNSTYGGNIALTDIDSSFIDLNTYCQTGFSYIDKNSQVQSGIIGINGLVDVSQSVMGNIETLGKSANSWISYDIHLGKWIAVINKPSTSIASFNDSNILGEISISGTSLNQLCNIANIKYQNTDILDKTDFVKISIPSNQLLQNEPRNTIEISLPYTNKQSVAIKIGLLALKQARIDKVISFTADYSYINLRAGEVIDVTNAIYGYTNKLFRIISATEVEGQTGDLQVEFKCLEYDDNVYTYSIQEYNVQTDSGILGIGSIGKPDVPTVTKTEVSNTPRIVINAIVPSGVVDSMEFWITFDTTVQNDSARTYVKIGVYSNTDGLVLTENQSVSYTYSQLSQSDFFIKVRGVNNVTSGQFSDPTGLIAYVPTVVADTISDTPVSGIGGQLMGLGLLTLLNNLDLLYKGLSDPGSLFDKIFSVFKDKTGVDLVGNASDGSLVVASSLAVKDEGTQITSNTSSINFVGDGVIATANGNDVTVTIAGSSSYSGDVINSVCTVNGMIGLGRVEPSSPNAQPPAPSTCSSRGQWYGTRTRITGSPTSVTYMNYSNGKYLYKFFINNTGFYSKIKISGTSPSAFDGTYNINSQTTTYIILEYPTSPGTYVSGATISGMSSNFDDFVTIEPIGSDYNNNIIVVPNSSTVDSYTVSIKPNYGYLNTGDWGWSYKPNVYPYNEITSFSGDTIISNGDVCASANTPFIFTGTNSAVNSVLKTISFYHINGIYTIPNPPINAVVTLTITVTSDNKTDTHIVYYDYIDEYTLYPNKLNYDLSR